MNKIYRTLAHARNAFALDNGFDPWTVGMGVMIEGKKYMRPTKRVMALLGYTVFLPHPYQPRE